MSKQAQANKIFINGTNANLSRKAMILQIEAEVGVKPAYASTLYQNAKKKIGAPSTPKTKVATTHKKTVATSGAKVTSLADRKFLRQIRQELNDALAGVVDKYGLSGDIGNISFTDDKFTTKLTVNVGDATDAANREWNLYAWKHGLAENMVGNVVNLSGENFKIVKIKPKGRRTPVVAEKLSNGKLYRLTADSVKNAS